MIKACIFDLDGVIVDTAKYHFIAWRNLAHSLGITFTEKHNEELKGVGRMESLAYILNLGNSSFTDNELLKFAAAKNMNYLNLIEELDQSELLPGVIDLLEELKKNNIKIALGSSSKNAVMILQKLDISHFFEVIIDGTKTTKTKPDPQVFQLGAEQLNIKPSEIVVFEDAIKGVTAAINGGFKVIGIGDENELDTADQVIPGFENFNLTSLINIYS